MNKNMIKEIIAVVGGAIVCVALLVGLWLGASVAFRTVGRNQALADARNQVKVSEIQIQNQAQRIEVAKQKAEIRHQEAIGVRNAQDEIAKTLTPLYVQFEMVEALMAIARSGKNHSVVYIPSGANGIPLVSTTNPTEVGSPDDNG
jgi:hypothetical protein